MFPIDNYSLSDLAAVTRDNDGNGWGSGWFLIVVLFLFTLLFNMLAFRIAEKHKQTGSSGL